MTALYRELDPKVALSMEGLKPSCKAGCTGCCHLLVLISLPEAVALAEYVLQNVERRKMVPELSARFWKQAQAIEQGGIRQIRTSYFKKKVPCGFLNTETNLCMVYEARPPACRYHFAVSPPENCSPDVEADVSRVDTREAELVCLGEANKVSKQVKIPLYVAPLPIAMLWAFKLLIEGRASFDASMNDPNLGVLNLNGWMQTLRSDEAIAVPPEAPSEVALPTEELKTQSPETPAGGSV